MPFFDWYANNASAARPNEIGADDGVERPIGALHEDVRLQTCDDQQGVVLVEYDDPVDAPKGSQDLRAFLLWCNWPRRAFDGSNRSIRIQTDHQRVAFTPRLLEIPDMTWMQEIEHAVGEDNRQAATPQSPHELDCFVARQNHLNRMFGEKVQVCSGR